MTIRGEFVETVTGAPPDGWEHGDVAISLRNPNGRALVEAWRRGAFAVHEVERIEALTDWDAIKKELPFGTELYPKVRKVIDEIAQTNAD